MTVLFFAQARLSVESFFAWGGRRRPRRFFLASVVGGEPKQMLHEVALSFLFSCERLLTGPPCVRSRLSSSLGTSKPYATKPFAHVPCASGSAPDGSQPQKPRANRPATSRPHKSSPGPPTTPQPHDSATSGYAPVPQCLACKGRFGEDPNTRSRSQMKKLPF